MNSKYAYQKVPEHCILGGAAFEDLGEQIRKQVKDFTNPAGLSTEVNDKLSAQIDSLERLSGNIYAKKYQRRYTSTATGLSAEQCSQVLSSEFLQYLNDEKLGEREKSD